MKNSNGFESFIAQNSNWECRKAAYMFFLVFCNSPFRNALPLFICLRNSVFCITYLQKNLIKKRTKNKKPKTNTITNLTLNKC